ncbi:TPA: hypothetical protein DEX28_00205 [Patescibacteria group bacterium]|uniref:DNA polymerase III delta N-terminal domain-containing protein n=1 Tax=Candidatus Woesebacteria bacterium GW2011_GWB1_44_11b TaxID=1618580 RepID=A0A0G1GI36_9BACT|nr:MAG: hypothetical protein UW21_C0005G0012 [Candidatus Woesebacteria bacterium GW2011_GWB1_44_11b]HCI05154.1 hypothetical protein [Patescibacteria group bacterium]
MIYYFYGKDWFLTKLEADKKVSELLGQGFKKVFLTSLSELKEAVKSNSLFSDKKVFVFMTEKLNESEKKEFQKLKFFDEQAFVFIEKNAAPTLLFGRAKVEKTRTGEFGADWLKKQAKEFGISAKGGPASGGEISKDLVDYFLTLDGKDFDAGFFYFELLKLSLFKPGQQINLADYFELSQNKQELNYFDWIHAVLEKQTARALKFVPKEDYECLIRIKSLINIFELILVAEDKSLPPTGKFAFLSRNRPFWVNNLRQWSGRMDYQEKLESLLKLLAFEASIKTGRLSSQESLKLFIIG